MLNNASRRITGGFKVYICGCSELAQKLQNAYRIGGEREFDFTLIADEAALELVKDLI